MVLVLEDTNYHFNLASHMISIDLEKKTLKLPKKIIKFTLAFQKSLLLLFNKTDENQRGGIIGQKGH